MSSVKRMDILNATNKRFCSQSAIRDRDKILVPNSSRCGEIYVTKNAEKWTFICSYCQKVTGDIGVFICHIKLEHLDDRNPTKQINTNIVEPLLSDTHPQLLSISNLKLRTIPEIVKVSSLTESKMTKSMDMISKKPLQQHLKSADKTINKDVFEVIYLNDDENKNEHSIMIDDDDGEDEENDVIIDDEDKNQLSFSLNDMKSNGNGNEVEFINENNDEMEDNGLLCIQTNSGENETDYINCRSSVSKNSRLKRKQTDAAPHKCQYCNKGFKSKQAIFYHIKTHEKKRQFHCPLCSITHCTENLFISHVLTHENESCFPCQVCAKVSASREERNEHLKTHEAERPYGCDFCQRRFRKKHFLTNHLRLHCQYQCDFCPAEFSSTQAQRRPYVCLPCEKSADIRKKAEQQRSLTIKNQVFDSDQE